MPNATVGLRLDDETQKRLKQLGKKRDCSPHYLMKEAVEDYLAQQEAVEAEKDLMNERWQHYALTGESISHEDVKVWANNLGTSSKTD